MRVSGIVLQPLEHLPARQCPFELAHKLLEVVLHNAIEIHQFAVDVIDHLDLRRWSHEVKSGPAREDLDVTLVRREARDQMVRGTLIGYRVRSMSQSRSSRQSDLCGHHEQRRRKAHAVAARREGDRIAGARRVKCRNLQAPQHYRSDDPRCAAARNRAIGPSQVGPRQGRLVDARH